MDNKNIFAKNLRHYMHINEKSRKEVSEAIGVSYYTFSDWVKGKKYPRMDKVELLARYFGCLKSDLIEDKKNPATENGNGISKAKEKLIEKVMQMSDAEIQKLELLLQIVEAK